MPYQQETRIAAFERCKLGPEATPGTPVAATLIPASVSIVPTIATESQTFRPAGTLAPTIVAPSKVYTNCKLTAAPTYEELPIIFSAICKDTTGVHSLNIDSPNTPQCYTVEFGTGAQCQRMAMGTVSGFSMKWVQDKSVECTADMWGGALVAADETTGLTMSAVTPIHPAQVSISCSGVIQTRVFEAELSVANHWVPVRPISNVTSGFVNLTEQAPELKFTILVENDAQGKKFVDDYNTGGNPTKKFAITMTDGAKSIVIELGAKVTGFTEFQDKEGIYAYGVEFVLVPEDSLGTALKVTVA